MTKVVYTDDVGVAYWMRLDASNATLAGATLYDGTNAAGGRLPTGIQPRKRYLRHPTTGRERSFVCPDVTQALWTDAVGVVHATTDFGTLANANYVTAGRTGEVMRS